MAITLWKPRFLSRMRRDFDEWDDDFSWIDDVFSALPIDTGYRPSMETYVKDRMLHLRAEVPGVDPDDLDISFSNGHLCITGERKSAEKEEGACYCTEEMSYGKFTRCFHVPRDVDATKIHAKYDKGLLDIAVPLGESVVGKKIPIEGVEKKSKELTVT